MVCKSCALTLTYSYGPNLCKFFSTASSGPPELVYFSPPPFFPCGKIIGTYLNQGLDPSHSVVSWSAEDDMGGLLPL